MAPRKRQRGAPQARATPKRACRAGRENSSELCVVCWAAGGNEKCEVARRQCREPRDERGKRLPGHIALNWNAPDAGACEFLARDDGGDADDTEDGTQDRDDAGCAAPSVAPAAQVPEPVEDVPEPEDEDEPEDEPVDVPEPSSVAAIYAPRQALDLTVLGTSPATFNLIIHALAPVLATTDLVLIALSIARHLK